MLAKYTVDTLPHPTDPAIDISTIPAETIAVLRYEERRLLNTVTKSGLVSAGPPFS